MNNQSKVYSAPRAAVVHLNFRAESTFPVLHLALWAGLAGATRLTRSDFKWAETKGQICVRLLIGHSSLDMEDHMKLRVQSL